MSLAAPQLPPGFTLRAPWPDELPRLRSLLAASPSPHPVHLRALFHHAPERLMGGYAIARPAEGPDGILYLRLRPAWSGFGCAWFLSSSCGPSLASRHS